MLIRCANGGNSLLHREFFTITKGNLFPYFRGFHEQEKDQKNL